MKKFILCALLFPVSSFAKTATLTWSPNAAIDSVDHYNVYRSKTSGVYDKTMPLASVPGSTRDANGNVFYVDTIDNASTFFYVVTAFATSGVESDFSNEVVSLPPKPAAPVLSITTTISASIRDKPVENKGVL
jgi:fibronectin type 3 domain-containing protein